MVTFLKKNPLLAYYCLAKESPVTARFSSCLSNRMVPRSGGAGPVSGRTLA